MSLSPNSSLLRRTIDLKYANRQRSASIKWIFINGALFLLFTLDLWYKCPGHTSTLHYVEACLAAGACASAVRHALRLAAPRAPAPPARISRSQRALLGLAGETLDSSFCLEADESGGGGSPRAPEVEEAASLSPARSWRSSSSPHASPPALPTRFPAAAPERAPRDEFIANADHLQRYLSSVNAAGAGEGGAWSDGVTAYVAPATLPSYQVSAPEREQGAASAPAATGLAPPWRRLDLDPARLAHFNLNLRQWLHATILERLVREMEECDGALAAGGHEARVGAVEAARLAAVATAAGGELARRLRALLPFLRPGKMGSEKSPFDNQEYVVRRVRELARGGCLAAYRWDGGGAGWDAAAKERRLTDAELVLHLFAAYLDGVVPGAGADAAGGAFSAAHVSAGAVPPRGAGVLALHRAAQHPPHYVVVLGHEVLEACRGRDNLLHSLLLFLAAAARRDPPALLRLHLGPAGLNMLWILDR